MADKNQRSINVISLITIIACLLLGGCVGFFGMLAIDGMTDGNAAQSFLYLLLLACGVVLAFITQIIFHEGGHLILGRMSGYRFVSFNVLGYLWQRGADGRLHVRRMQLPGAAGQCLMAPPDDPDGEFPFLLYNLGGVLANLIAAALFALLTWLIPMDALRIVFAAQTIAGIALALMNGLPYRNQAVQNDAANILAIRRSPHARRAFWVQMSIAARTGLGERLRDMPDDWFRPFPEDEMDNPIVCTVPVMKASRLMDQLDFPAALEAVNALLAREKGILGLYRMTMTCDGAVCELLTGRPGRLTAALDAPKNQQLMKSFGAHPAILRTRYAVALLRDRNDAAAEKHLAAFDAAAKKHPYPQEIAGEREILQAVQKAAEAHI